VPEWLRPYVLVLAEFVVVVGVVAAILSVAGLKAAPFCSLLLVLFVIAAAWHGYGPGFLNCFLTLFVVPRLLLPHRPHAVDLIQLALLLLTLFLVSRLGVTTRRAAATRAKALDESETRYRLLFENSPQPMWVYDRETLRFLTVNDTAIQSYGYSREEFLGMTLRDIRPEEDIPKLLEATATPLTGFNREGQAWRHRKKDGQIISVEISEHTIVFDGSPACLVMAIDITERIRLEEQFRQSQRLETVGRLAGGVAHDFNNLLTIIVGYAEMLLTNPDAAPFAAEITEIQHAGERAADLTRQLLAFSRRQALRLSVMDVNAVVGDTEKMLRRLIGENIELVTNLSPNLGLIQADSGQIQQVIRNLVVNSRDAMPERGTVLIETRNVDLDEGYRAQHPGVEPGPHIFLAVSDTGTGMSPEVRAQIFEPFFTTKNPGKGTGLGLATVYGIVKQLGGWIWVYSEPGRGTSFKIYFPRSDEKPSKTKQVEATGLRGRETILVVEDEEEVLKLAMSGLRGYGYSVHGVGTGVEALNFCREFSGAIDLLLTDVVMTDMNGRQVAERIRELRPDTKVLFMSGYTANVIAHGGVLDADVECLLKPFTPESLARKIREVLGEKGEARSSNS